MVRHVIWPAKSQNQLAKIVKYISLDSRQNAEKVKTEILASTRNLVANPEMHAEDKYKKNNDGSFRAYELYHYRIAYRITVEKIIITRIRHTSMVPKIY
jgi:plasmid stabilization system protein ParE